MRPYFLFLIVLVVVTGCDLRGACYQKSLDDRQCPEGYACINADVKIGNLPIFHLENRQVYIIRSQAEQDSVHPGRSNARPVDYTRQSLVYFKAQTNWADGYEAKGSFCQRASDGSYLVAIDYSLSGQCRGSGIDHLILTYEAIVDQLPEDAVVRSQMIDINPI
ncbi:MAG: hypothetical protein ACFB10_10585 [Salibacteraceae bacterium]